MEKKKNYNLIIGIAALVAIVLIIVLVGYLVSKPRPHVIQGETEAVEYRISCMVPGHVTELYYREGQEVHKGDTVAFIDSPQVRAKLAQAQAARSAAKAQSTKAQNGAQKEQIAGAYELWQQALVQEDIMKKSFERVKNLYEQKVIAAQKYDETKAKYDAAVAQAKAAKSQYDMAVEGARKEEKAAAAAQVARARGAVAEVNSYINETVQIAQMEGEVSDVFPKVGELIGSGSPIMTISVMSDMWGAFNVREDQLNGLQVGSEFTAFVPAFNKDVKMKVYYMKDQGSYAVWKATKTTGQYDLKTFQVKAKLAEKFEGLRPGMSLIIRN